mgnify:FL=1
MALIKTRAEIRRITAAGAILKSALHMLAERAKEGVALNDLDRLARQFIREAGAEPSFLGYQPEGARRPYPAALCASLNEVVVHGVPSKRVLKNGDILKLDLGAKVEGYHADAAITISIGTIAKEEEVLMRVTHEALMYGIRAARGGNTLGDIGHAIETHVKKHGFHVVHGLTGHGVGKALHEEPSVFNEGKPGKGMRLQPGMTLAIEPMVAMGTARVHQLVDESYATMDGSMSAHFEHTILITERGPKILTG